MTQLSHYIHMDDQAEELLAALEKSEQSIQAGSVLYTVGEPTAKLYVVKSGWFIGYTHLPDGGRHVVRIYVPGDVIGLAELALHRLSTDLRSVTDGSLCPFEKKDLDEIFKNAPRLTALLFTLNAREQISSIDTLRAISRMGSPPRIAFFLLQLLSRLRITNPGMSNRFRLPLTQTDIGDSIGLSNVSVSRTWTRMEADGLIERDDGEVIIPCEGALRDLCDFIDHYDAIDISWFPE